MTKDKNNHIPFKTSIQLANSPQAFESAIQLIESGSLVAFPTDTVYGLGAALFNSEAIEQLYIVKGRDDQKAIAVLLGNLHHINQLTEHMGSLAEKLARAFWPGPLTLVVASHPDLPKNLSPRPTVGVRMPDHPVALQLLNLTGPLAVTSANCSGEPSTRTASEVYAQLKGRIPLILDGGQTPGGAPSTVVDCTQEVPLVLRPGPITLDQIEQVLGLVE